MRILADDDDDGLRNPPTAYESFNSPFCANKVQPAWAQDILSSDA